MIDTSTLPVFLAAVAALLIVPGPDFILISTQSVSRGARYGLACALGVLMAGILQTMLVAVGLGKIMEIWPKIATAIRLCGAAYLAYLGIKLVIAWLRRGKHVNTISKASAESARALMLVGLINNLLNPKALLFFSVFIPQFVSPTHGPASHQIVALGLLLSLSAFAYNVAISWLFAMVRSWRVDLSGVQKHSEGVLGALFIGLATRMMFARST